jgi:hypothetical protein
LLLQSPEKLGYETPLWTCARVAHLIDNEFGVEYHPGHVWKILDDLGWSCQRPVGRARERNEEAIGRWRRVEWPAIKKSPKRRAYDHLHRRKRNKPAAPPVRTWSRRGETPVLQYNFNWDTLSVAAGITF